MNENRLALTELEIAERQFGKRRAEISDELKKRVKTEAPGGKVRVANPEFSATDDRVLAEASKWSTEMGELGGALWALAMAAGIMGGAMLSSFAAGAALCIAATAGVIWLETILIRRGRALKELQKTHRRHLFLVGWEGTLVTAFTTFAAAIRSHDPGPEVLASVEEAETAFNGLVVSAERFQAESLAESTAARINRDQMISLVADAACLAEFTAERRATALALEAACGVNALNHAQAFQGLAQIGASVKNETTVLDSVLKQMETMK